MRNWRQASVCSKGIEYGFVFPLLDLGWNPRILVRSKTVWNVVRPVWPLEVYQSWWHFVTLLMCLADVCLSVAVWRHEAFQLATHVSVADQLGVVEVAICYLACHPCRCNLHEVTTQLWTCVQYLWCCIVLIKLVFAFVTWITWCDLEWLGVTFCNFCDYPVVNELFNICGVSWWTKPQTGTMKLW